MLYSHEQLYVHICMQKYNDAIKTSGHSSLEKYTFYFTERVVCERELETEQNCNILTPPQLFWLSQPFFTVLLGCLTGGQLLLGHGSHSSIFCPTDLNFLSPGLYNNLTRTYFLRASQFAFNLTPRQSRSPLISWYLRPDAPVIYTCAFLLLTAWPGRRSICNIKAEIDRMQPNIKCKLWADKDGKFIT